MSLNSGFFCFACGIPLNSWWYGVNATGVFATRSARSVIIPMYSSPCARAKCVAVAGSNSLETLTSSSASAPDAAPFASYAKTAAIRSGYS